MAGKKSAGKNTKEAVNNTKKVKADAADKQKAAADDEDWENGKKNVTKSETEAAKKAKKAREKEERDEILKKEEDAGAAPKLKKTRGLDLSQLGNNNPSGSRNAPALNATGIDNALDALSLTTSDSMNVDKHPERRFKAAYAAYEERRLKEMEADGSGQGLRLNQKKEKIKKEFEKSGENPFNQVSAAYDSTKGEIVEIREREKAKIEKRLADK